MWINEITITKVGLESTIPTSSMTMTLYCDNKGSEAICLSSKPRQQQTLSTDVHGIDITDTTKEENLPHIAKH